MPGVTTLGDQCTGHGSFPPRASVSASADVKINKKGAVRVGDAWEAHCNGVPVCHGGISVGGSGLVKVNGMSLVRIGDAIDCGSAVAAGSGNVKAGG